MCRRRPGSTKRASPPSSPGSTMAWVVPRRCTAPPSTGCASRTSVKFVTTAASRPPGRSATTTWSRTTRCRAEVPGPRRAGRGSDRPPASAPYPFPAVAHEPRIQQLSDDLAAAGYRPFHAPCGSGSSRRTCRTASACGARLRRLPVPAARQVRRRGARRPPRTRAPRHLRTDAAGGGARDQTRPDRVTQVVVERDGESTVSGRHRRRGRGAANSASCCSLRHRHTRKGSRRLGSGRPHFMSHDSPAVLACPRSRTRPSSRTPSASTTSTSAAGLRLPDGRHPDDRQVPGGDVRGEKPLETKFAPTWALATSPRTPWTLAVHRGPAGAETGSPSPGRRGPPRRHAEQPTAAKRLYAPAPLHARLTRHAPGHLPTSRT